MRDFTIKNYYDETSWDNDVLDVIEADIETLNDPFDIDVTYGGREDSRTFHFSEWLVPEFTDDINWICYFHDRMYELWENGTLGYSKEFADELFHDLLIAEDFPLADIYYWSVKNFG